MVIKVVIGLTLCLLSFGSALAAEECGNGIASDMLECSKGRFEETNKEMNHLYQNLLTRKRNENARQVFEDSQKEWLGFRSDYCKEKAPAYQGGSMAPVVENLCRAQVTKSRIKTFKALSLKGLQGSTR